MRDPVSAAVALLEPDRRDAMAEMVNIGMGQAGASLARLFDAFIQLSVPRVQIVEPRSLTATLVELCGADCAVTVARQAFASRIRGEALVIFTDASVDGLADLVGYPGASADELLLDITNVLVAACVGGLADQFGFELACSAPSLLGCRGSVNDVLTADEMVWAHALLAEVSFRVEGRPFRCHLLTFWPDASMAMLVEAVDRLLATL